MVGFNDDLQSQMELISEIIKQNSTLYEVINKAQYLGLKHYYIGAGSITQTVWNYQVENDPMYGISDIDFVYFDDLDLSFEAENSAIKSIENVINPGNIKLDIKNQARVHIWYSDHFGYDIKPYISIEAAINTWPTTATSIGIRIENNNFKIYAPFGLNDLFGMIVRANKAHITEKIYNDKVKKWKSKWPSLTIIPW